MTPLDVLLAPLAWLGRQGTRAMMAVVVVGIAFPWLGRQSKPYVSEAIFLLLCIAFMRVDITAAKNCLRRPRLVVMATLWTSVIIPVLCGLLYGLLGLDRFAPELFLGLMLQAVASPIMAAPSLAVLMGLDGTLVLVTLVLSSALVPLTAPLFAHLFVGAHLVIPPFALAGKLFVILAGAALAGFVLRRLIGVQAIIRRSDSINGINILILFIFVAAIMENVAARAAAEPLQTVAVTALSFVIFFAMLLLSYVVFLRAGRERALAIGFVVSQRNMGLMLAATGAALPDGAWLYFALAQFPIFLAPRMLQSVVRRAIDRHKRQYTAWRGPKKEKS